jgi:ubiquinone/menaquinone biosynthesis C-methylase UbiE
MKKLLLPLLLCGALGAEPHKHHHHHHDFSDIPRWVEAFEESSREAWQKPAAVVDYLQLKPGQVVADVGASSGYFSRPLAKAVGPSGWVFAVDIEPGFFAPMHKLAAQQGIHNLATILATASSSNLPPASTDLIFICDTWHHIENRPSYLEHLKACLRPGGRIAVVDFFDDRDIPVGPKKEERLSPQSVSAEFQKAGLKVEQNLTLLPYQYIVVGQL